MVIVLTKLMSSSFILKVSTNIVDLSYHLALAPKTYLTNTPFPCLFSVLAIALFIYYISDPNGTEAK